MSKPQRQGHLIVHELDDDILIYDPSQDRSHRLNTSAALIWQHCDGLRSAEDLAEILTLHYKVDLDAALRDTQAMLQTLDSEKLIAATTTDA